MWHLNGPPSFGMQALVATELALGHASETGSENFLPHLS